MKPAGDLTPFREVLFPYDPALEDGAKRKDLEQLASVRSYDMGAEEIVETYRYGTDGRISVDIENRTSGYHKTFKLGTV